MVTKAKALKGQALTRARERGLPFDITTGWVLTRLLVGRCEVSGLRFDDAPKQGRGQFIPSIDRRNPEAGYTEANCRLVVWIYNAAKGVGTDEDVMRLAKALAS
jgi:hypothetical protein